MRRRLLLVEDSPTMRRMIAAMLTQEGYDVALAFDGNQGLDKAREIHPELILSDYEMPELDGPGLLPGPEGRSRRLRQVPVIMLTTLGATESKVLGLDAGADDYLEKPKSPDDLQELFARIRAQLRIADLRAALDKRNAQLEAAQAKLNLELNLARKVQMGLMPGAPSPRGVIRLAVRYRPANELGGDVYDFSRLDDGRLGILVADVSGHGVNSALLSGVVKALASPLSAAGAAPDRVLAGLDAGVEQFFPDGYFCTGFYVLIDETTGAFDFAGFGHPPGFIAGPNGSRPLDGEAGLLGVGMGELISTSSGQLAPGESLLIYTDGLPDAMTPADVPFGNDRIIALLDAHKGETPSAILDAIEKAVAEHVAPGLPHDDINLVLVQYPVA